jgi:diphosphoinositol-polyphosphate diphosphatase
MKSGPDSARVLLISAHGGKGMVFPKGGWETDETVEAAAKRETIEEAGVRGVLEEPMLGVFSYSSAKASRLALSSKPRGMAHMFVMHVAEELQKWPEADRRTRLWLPVEEACRQCRHEWMREVLRVWAARQGWTGLDLGTPAMADVGRTAVQPVSAVTA